MLGGLFRIRHQKHRHIRTGQEVFNVEHLQGAFEQAFKVFPPVFVLIDAAAVLQ